MCLRARRSDHGSGRAGPIPVRVRDRLCGVVGLPELATDPRFRTNAGRVRHRGELVPRLAAALRQRTGREWAAALDAAGVPCGPIQSVGQALQDPQVRLGRPVARARRGSHAVARCGA